MNSVSVSLEFSEQINESDILLFAALRDGNELKSVVIPDIASMNAEFDIPNEFSDCDVILYVWNKDQKPYASPLKLQ